MPLVRKTQPYAKKIAHKGIWVEPELLAGVPKDQSAVKLTEILQSRTGEQKLRVTRVEPIHDSENELKGYAAFAQP